MVEVVIDHSYEDDYFMISSINVVLEDKKEMERIQKIADTIIGAFVYPDVDLTEKLAKKLGVDRKMIDIDTNEIDLM